jgi:hypothetical protein
VRLAGRYMSIMMHYIIYCMHACSCNIIASSYILKKKKNLRLKTNNKSTGKAQSANYLKSRTDYTTQCQLVNAKQETTNSILHRNIDKVTDPKNLRLKTNNKSTGEAQSANYLKSRTDYTTQCQLVNAKQETTNTIFLHRNVNKVTDPRKRHARTLTK